MSAVIGWEHIIVWLVSGIVLPCVAWLVKAVLKIQSDFTKFQAATEQRMKDRDESCQRHNNWTNDIQKTVVRSDKNIVRLCESQGVDYERE